MTLDPAMQLSSTCSTHHRHLHKDLAIEGHSLASHFLAELDVGPDLKGA